MLIYLIDKNLILIVILIYLKKILKNESKMPMIRSHLVFLWLLLCFSRDRVAKFWVVFVAHCSHLDNNSLSGTIPDSLASLPDLTEL